MRGKVLVCVAVWLAATAVCAASEVPTAVSPGSHAGVSPIDDRCPTFSWGGVAGASGYELVVYLVADDGAATEVSRQRFEGSVYGWTPGLDDCLTPGGQYAWSVRALGRKSTSDWSAPALLRVAAAPGEAQLLEALAVVRRYLEANPGAGLPDEAAAALRDTSVEEAAAESEAPHAPAVTEFSVTGGVVAASFTGEGSTLTDLDPANLSAGTAAIDISGTAATASNLVGGASVSEAELEFDPATQAEMDAHAGAADAHREHATLEESAEIDSDIATHAALATVHHAPPDLAGHAATADAHREHATLEESAEIDSDIATHAGMATAHHAPPDLAGHAAVPSAHHTPTVDTVLTEAQVEGYVTDDPLDMGNNPITNIGAAGTDFTATGGLRVADDLRIDGDVGIGIDPAATTNAHIYLYDGGIYSGPYLEISGHNQARVRMERRRTDGGWYDLISGCGSVNCANDFQITHSSAGSCLAIRDGCELEIPKLELNSTDSPDACGSTTEGRVYYDASLNEPCFCNGTSWTQFDGGGTC